MSIRNQIEIEASADNLQQVLQFVSETLESAAVSPKTMMQLEIAVEEIFVNIASYAYSDGAGLVSVFMEIPEGTGTAVIVFEDNGKPFDPLDRADPDVTKPAEERQIGGLGIFMARKLTDDIAYEYSGGKNRLTMKKKLT